MTDDRVVPLKKRREVCPICGAPAQEKNRPFCSTRCAEIDLGRWLKGSYRIPSEEAPSPEEIEAEIRKEEEES